MPEHPRADSQGYVREAVLVWEKHNKQPFPEGMHVLYVNGDKDDLSKDNLRPMSPSDFSAFHAYARRREGLGRYNSGIGGKCPPEKLSGYLKEWDELQEQKHIQEQIDSFDLQ
jgi:hypothetical protein